MNSLRNTDQKDEQGQKDLEEHLKSDDFFSTSRFPKAFFSATSIVAGTSTDVPSKEVANDPISNYKVTGYLAIKGIINVVTFPAHIQMKGKAIRVKAEISIDRTNWGITYQSKSIFADLKDGVIEDEIKILVDLQFIQAE
jgi:polyisoprenoid-binding protein YceI